MAIVNLLILHVEVYFEGVVEVLGLKKKVKSPTFTLVTWLVACSFIDLASRLRQNTPPKATEKSSHIKSCLSMQRKI